MTVIINGSSGITNVNGTAAAPAETGTDTDSGIVYGTNTVSLATSGTAALTVDASQNVSIGTASVGGKLTVAGAAGGVAGYFTDSTNSSLVVATLTGGVTLGTDGGGQIHLATNGSAAVNRRLSIDASGNVTFTNAFSKIFSISASVAANALTISASPLSLDFRSTTLGSGTITTVAGTPANLVISSGSTLGTVSGQQSKIVVLAMNNAGTIELAAVNISGGNQLDETNLISTTAEGGAGAADSANVIYSTTARSNLAYRVIGFIQSTQTTAGTWATAPSTIQGSGGQALNDMGSIGYGQVWGTVSRAFATTYYNTTGKPISVAITVQAASAGANTWSITVGGVTLPQVGGNSSASLYQLVTVIVPAGAAYSFNNSSNSLITACAELR